MMIRSYWIVMCPYCKRLKTRDGWVENNLPFRSVINILQKGEILKLRVTCETCHKCQKES